jgi:hypothetical protein
MAETVILGGERHVVVQCGSCAVWHTVPEIVYDCHKREGGYHSCPNGHQRGWDKGTDAIERENTRRERDRLKQEAARLQDEIAAERKRADEAEKKVLQAKRRANAGVCQCCNRTFLNVQRHMKTKHPNVIPLEQKSA